MNGHALRTIALNEVRLRLRRPATLVALLAVVALSWLMIPAPGGDTTLIAIDGQRALYTSATLAFGSAHLACLLLGLGGFYLVRGRVAEDLRSGMALVIGATPAGNGVLALGRWLGGLAYLGCVLLAYLAATVALHGLRGEGPIQPLVYLQTYAVLMLPMACFGASCAVLFDHLAPLVGRAGDVLYFFLWCLQFSILIVVGETQLEWPMLLDFSGLSVGVVALRAYFDTSAFALGATSYDAALAPIAIPDSLWTLREVGARAVTLCLALLPLLPAAWLFHRYSPDRLHHGSAARGGRLARLAARASRTMLAPAALLSRPLPGLALRVPGCAGEMLAEAAVALRTSPLATAALAGTALAAWLAPTDALPGVMTLGVASWGITICGIAPRDWQAGADAMTAALPGGALRRYWRQGAASLLLAVPCLGVVALRWAADEPLRAAAAVSGALALAGAAAAMGSLTRGSRLFLGLFLFAWYVALNATGVAALDMVGFNGAASAASAAAWLAAGVLAWSVGLAQAASCWSR